MNKKHVVAAALALSLSLSMATANTQAAEVSTDLGANTQQLIAEIQVGTADWNKMVVRIDELVAQIDEQILEGTGDFDELGGLRRRLMRARARIIEQYLPETAIAENGEALIGENGEVLTGENGKMLTGENGELFTAANDGVGFGSSLAGGNFGGATLSGGGGGFVSGGSSGGGFGGVGALAGVFASFAAIADNDKTGLIAANTASDVDP